MYFDEKGFLNSEINPPGNPGRIGDAGKNTQRFYILKGLNTRSSDQNQMAELVSYCESAAKVMDQTRTPTGYVCHPDSTLWRETNFSNDDWLPRFLCAWYFDPADAKEMIERIRKANWVMGNGEYANVMVFAVVWAFEKSPFPMLLALLAQRILFFFPQWDSQKKTFVSPNSSSADWLTWICAMGVMLELFPKSRILRVASKPLFDGTAWKKVLNYFEKEPNAGIVLAPYQSFLHGS